MQQLTFTAPHVLEWQDVPEPRLEGDGEAIVAPLAIATCDLDSAILTGQTPFQPPIALGHECIGEVVEIGDGVTSVKPGDRVVIPFQVSCGECGACREGRTGNCETGPPMQMYGFGAAGGDWGGALSDLMRVPYADHMLVPLPDHVDPEAVASVADNVVDAWRTVGPQLAERPGADVLVVGGAGPGSIGMYAAGIAVALGASNVNYIDNDEDRLGRAQRLGASVVADASLGEKLGSYPITVDASSNPAGLRSALRSTARDGTCTSTGIYFEDAPLPLFEMYSRGCTFITGRCHARPAIPPVLDLIAAGKLEPEIVTEAVVPWDDAPDALPHHAYKQVVSRQNG
jgi:alcohol dehydrogenase